MSNTTYLLSSISSHRSAIDRTQYDIFFEVICFVLHIVALDCDHFDQHNIFSDLFVIVHIATPSCGPGGVVPGSNMTFFNTLVVVHVIAQSCYQQDQYNIFLEVICSVLYVYRGSDCRET